MADEPGFRDLVDPSESSLAERIFPELPEGYFEDHPGLERKKPEPPDSVPFVRIRDLNKDDGSGESSPKPGAEIGWKWSF